MISHGSLKTYIKEDPTTNTRQSYTYLAISEYEFMDGLKQTKMAGNFESMGVLVDTGI